jgi:hypothetical protein
MTTVVADTGNVLDIIRYQPEDAAYYHPCRSPNNH